MSDADSLEPRLEDVLDHAPQLADAIASGEIETVYQPQFCLGDGSLTGSEALARWRHPALGTIGAGPLLAVAEMQGAMSQLSRQVVDNALREFTHWPSHLSLSLNVMPEEIAAPSFAESLIASARESSVDTERVTLEITEDVLLGDLPEAAVTLGRLKEGGFSIALDDFGAGFCNFRYLKILPLDYLKLDRSMVDGIATDERDLAVLRGIIAMADALGLKVIAEGIESEAQRAIVASEGAHVFQGFLRAAPMSAKRFRELALAQAAF